MKLFIKKLLILCKKLNKMIKVKEKYKKMRIARGVSNLTNVKESPLDEIKLKINNKSLL